MKINKHVFVSC